MLRFLITDDSIPTRQWLRQLVQAQPGWHVAAEAADGQQAAQSVKREPPDVVLMDVAMPGMNGLQATRRIKSIAPGIKVILFSAYAERGYRRGSLEAGADAYIEKTDLTAVRLGELISRLFDKSPGELTLKVAL